MAPLNDNDWTAAHRLFCEGGLSVVLPCYNLAGRLTANLRRLDALLAAQGFPYQLIPVDDGSTDGSAEELRVLAAELPSVQPVYFPENRGKGAALLSGAARVQHAWVLLLDGDLDLDPTALPAFCDVAERTGADVIAYNVYFDYFGRR